MPSSMFKEKILYGINASPGICIGNAYLLNQVNMDIVEKYYLSTKALPAEIKRFKAAVKKTRDELNRLIKKTPDAMQRQTGIFESHLMMLKDKMLYDKVIETCEQEQVNAEWAVKNVAANLKMMFHQMENPYLSARVADLTHVTDSVIKNLVGVQKVDMSGMKKRVILVADDLSPAQTSQISLKKTQGFVTNKGGKTSHTSIIARTLGIPAVLGLDGATDLISDDDLIIVDGTEGIVVVNPEEKTLLDFAQRQEAYDNYEATLTLNSDICAKTTDDVRLMVMGNIELPEETDSVISHGGDGIGLYRTEFQYLNCPTFPSEDDLFEKYKSVVEAMAPKPVTIRTLDINGDKAIGSMSGPHETNPFLGLRAIRYCLKNPDIFKTQLKAILRSAVFGNVKILFPMISCYDEIIMARELLNQAASVLDGEGTTFNMDIDIGIMLEIPSAIIMADKLAEQVDFFSFGTNDLIQYSLAIDRGNRDVAYLYDGLQPAVIRLMKHAADVGHKKGKKMSLCGEMAADSLYTPIILGLGIDELSMNPRSIPIVKNIIRAISMEESRQFLEEVLKQRTASDIMEMLQKTYGSLLMNKMY